MTTTATPAAGEAAPAFGAVDVKLEDFDNDWQNSLLVPIRIAAISLRDNEEQFAERWRGHLAELCDTVEGLMATPEHLDGLKKIVETAIARFYVVGHRLLDEEGAA